MMNWIRWDKHSTGKKQKNKKCITLLCNLNIPERGKGVKVKVRDNNHGSDHKLGHLNREIT